MSKKKVNRYLGSSVSQHTQEKMKDPEFSLAFELEQDRLRIARKIRDLREKQNLTQTELAGLIGTKQPSIARLERGDTWPRIDLLEKIAFALGTQLDIRFVRKVA